MKAGTRKFSVQGADGRFGPGGATYEESLALAGGDPSRVRAIVDGSAPMRSEALREAGIPGIRYLDAGSRGAGDGSRNYVLFDDSLATIVGKDGQYTPAQQIARLLREGRGAEVTDELYAQADPQELSRLYDAGATGMDMPMGPAALERARAGGFDTDTPLYHGSRKDFSAFRNDIEKKTDHGWYGEGAYFGDPETASIYAMNDPNVARPQGGNVIEAFARGNVYEWPEGRPAALDAQGAKEISQSLAAEGYAGANIYAPNDPDLWGEQAGSWRERVVFDPSNIRSRFARFDPRLSHLRNLSAGLAGAGALGLGLLSMPPSQAEAEQYLAERGLLQ